MREVCGKNQRSLSEASIRILSHCRKRIYHEFQREFVSKSSSMLFTLTMLLLFVVALLVGYHLYAQRAG